MFDLSLIGRVRIGVLGDAALDVHWYADMKKSELSRETPHYPLPVVREEFSPGAAGNLAANVAALLPGRLDFCGVIGGDWRGEILKEEFSRRSIGCGGLVAEPGRFTNAYCKPMRMGISDVIYEDPRIDFSSDMPVSHVAEAAVLDWLDKAEASLDALCVCDQFEKGCVTAAVRARLAEMRIPVFADSRYRIGLFRVKNGCLKPNEHECAAALLSLGAEPSEDMEENGRRLRELTGSDILLTLGENGSLWISEGETVRVPAVKTAGEVDICGAGDTYLAAFACSAAAGAAPEEAMRIASAASSVTVRKLGTTGTASREEIVAVMGNAHE